MINIHDNIWIPGEGYKYISNGNVWATEITLGRSDSIENWYDTNDDPPAPEDEEAEESIK